MKSILQNCISFFLVLTLACNSNSTQEKETLIVRKSPTASPRLDKYSFTIKTQMNSKIEYAGKEVENSNNSEIGVVYDVTSDSSGGARLKITYNKLVVDINKDGKGSVINASNGANSFDPVERILSHILGSSVFVNITPSGEVGKIEGGNAITEKVLTSLAESDETAKKTIEKQMSRLVGDDFIRNTVVETFNLIPDSGVAVGDSWSLVTRQSGDLPYQLNTTYTLKSIDASEAKIKVQSEIRSTELSATDLKSIAGTVKVSGKQKGEITVDAVTGIVKRSKSTTTIEGSVNVMQTEVPISVTIKKEIIGSEKY